MGQATSNSSISLQPKPKARAHAADIPPMSPVSAFPSVSLPGTLNSGRATIAVGNQQLNQDAEQIANPDNENLTNPLLGSSQSLLLAQAGAAVIRTSNEMLGTLLDIFA
jgi:hypothetical protein